MPEKLGDVLGAMLADVARARVQADVEALRIAEAYARDPLLKHLPVPRFRMPDLVVDLPVLVDGVDGSSGTGEPWKTPAPTKTEIVKSVKEGIMRSDIKLTKAQSTAVNDAVALHVDKLYASEETAKLSPGSIARELSTEAVGTVRAKLRKDPTGEQLRVLERVTEASITSLLAAKLAPSPTTEVKFTSAEIKDHGDAGNVVRLRVTISEDSYEVVDRDDGQGYTLSPE
jgi:hypothetical protein